MASVMSDARLGLVLDIVEIGDVPLVDVNILVLSGLMKQPRDDSYSAMNAGECEEDSLHSEMRNCTDGTIEA